jgi:hypothetical protein
VKRNEWGKVGAQRQYFFVATPAHFALFALKAAKIGGYGKIFVSVTTFVI